MVLKQRLERQLAQARDLSEKMLADFKTPREWVHKMHENCNHALWFAGHMAQADNFFLSLVAPDRAIDMPVTYNEQFGMGSRPTNQPEDYPPAEEVVARMAERRQTLLEVLDAFSDDDLARPTPDGAPDFLADYASVFEMAIWHEGLHSGQLSSVRRALGHGPVQA